jgi:methionyl-tRNA formyltransferase
MASCCAAVSVYYLSSGRLGVPLLDALTGDPRLRFLGLGTQPDRPCGRARRLEPTPVAAHAATRGIAADRLPSVNAPSFLERWQAQPPDLVVVAAFGQILKPALLGLPRLGCLNVHASLLPRHRGASPVSAALLAGDQQTGITFMRMDAGLDTGPIWRQVPVAIGPDETADHLETRLAVVAAAALVPCILDIVNGNLTPQAQPAAGATYAPKLRKEDGQIDWARNAAEIERRIRAMAPWPGAYTALTGTTGARRLQILAAAVADASCAAQPGEVVQADPAAWIVACGEGALRLLRVKAEGGSEMAAATFLRGHRIPPGTRLGTGTQAEA